MSNVLRLPYALAPVNGTAALYHRGAYGESMSSLVPTGEEESTPVHTISPKALLWRFQIEPPFVVKMDIEGGEALVLGSLVPLLIEAGAPLLLSVHEPWWPAGCPSIEDLLSEFTTVTELHDGGHGFYELECRAWASDPNPA